MNGESHLRGAWLLMDKQKKRVESAESSVLLYLEQSDRRKALSALIFLSVANH